ncbi:hypothetical protein FOS14_06800 [Skermania sp. ID1734]|uniref:hypothetical protein n=1 Tax=Skermania sp. ID1734 TaxID=2597516 RepID=UPI00118040E9|nr:hypothetical protein [Skermania sp. ID1734]TSE00724.1 hypothetical protein FOS14_06800 [Skermania sp. ID1734]
MRTTTGTTPSSLAATVADYNSRGWVVAETANGVSLVTDENICGIEVTGELADGVHEYLRANKLLGPVIALPGHQRREVHLVTGIARAALAIESLREMGATVHMDGAGIPLPPTQLVAGSSRWSVSPEAARWTPPVVAIAAAVRATNHHRGSTCSERAAC